MRVFDLRRPGPNPMAFQIQECLWILQRVVALALYSATRTFSEIHMPSRYAQAREESADCPHLRELHLRLELSYRVSRHPPRKIVAYIHSVHSHGRSAWKPSLAHLAQLPVQPLGCSGGRVRCWQCFLLCCWRARHSVITGYCRWCWHSDSLLQLGASRQPPSRLPGPLIEEVEISS